MQHWDKSIIRKLLNQFELGKEYVTRQLGGGVFHNDNAGLIKYLKQMETKGYCTKQRINGRYFWTLTLSGEDAKQLLNTDCFI